MLEIGKSYTIEQVVTPEMTARAIGSGGLEVFGTPFMMAMMEHAAMDCVQPDLPEGKVLDIRELDLGQLGDAVNEQRDLGAELLLDLGHRDRRVGKREAHHLPGGGQRRLGPHRRGDPHPGHHRQRPLPAEVQQQADGAEITPAASKEGGERRSPPSFCNARKKSCPAPSKALAIRGREPYNISSV